MRTVLSKDSTTIAFDQSGSGPAIILVGGALSERSAGARWLRSWRHTSLLSPMTVGDVATVETPRHMRSSVRLKTSPPSSKRPEDRHTCMGCRLARRSPSKRRIMVSQFRSWRCMSRRLLWMMPASPYQRITCRALGEFAASGRRGEAVEYFMANAVEVPAEMIAQMRQSPMWPAMERWRLRCL